MQIINPDPNFFFFWCCKHLYPINTNTATLKHKAELSQSHTNML